MYYYHYCVYVHTRGGQGTALWVGSLPPLCGLQGLHSDHYCEYVHTHGGQGTALWVGSLPPLCLLQGLHSDH